MYILHVIADIRLYSVAARIVSVSRNSGWRWRHRRQDVPWLQGARWSARSDPWIFRIHNCVGRLVFLIPTHVRPEPIHPSWISMFSITRRLLIVVLSKITDARTRFGLECRRESKNTRPLGLKTGGSKDDSSGKCHEIAMKLGPPCRWRAAMTHLKSKSVNTRRGKATLPRMRDGMALRIFEV